MSIYLTKVYFKKTYVIGIFALALIFLLLPPVYAESEQVSAVIWNVPQDIRADLITQLGTGTEQKADSDSKGAEILVVVAAVTLTVLARQTVTLAHDIRCGGTVILDKGGKLEVSCDKALIPGTTIIKHRNGKTEIFPPEGTVQQLIDLLSSITKK
ncbi:hypothetical protein [Methylomonas sp. AM2-LC]|uniref:hypothetical protein n=1 Tax=Methylomonas sp. AM2-LC TaxID=3153301 RepID=UPI0032630FFF